MGTAWQKVVLGEVAQIIMGQSPPSSTYNEADEGIPFYQGVTDFGQRFPSPRIYCTAPTRFAEPGDILLSVRAPIGRVNRCVESCSIGRGLSVFRAFDANDQTFLEFLLRSLEPSWNALEAQGSVFGNARKEDLQNLKIVWPSKPIRELIAEILGALDDKIECNRRINKTLEQMAMALYKHWFVDFGPFRNSEFVDSEPGRIPKGWEVSKLGDLLNINSRTINPQDFPEEEFLHFSIPAFDGGQIPIYELGAKILSNKFLLDSNRILVSKLNPRIYRVWTVFSLKGRKGITSTEFINYIPKQDEAWTFVNCYLRHEQFIYEFCSHATGTTGSRQRVPPISTLSFHCLLPPPKVLLEFEHLCAPYFKQINSNIEENQTLTRTRDYLLPRLLSGEIEVKATEEQISELV